MTSSEEGRKNKMKDGKNENVVPCGYTSKRVFVENDQTEESVNFD